jgi:GAF domain-containing protein
MSERMDPAGAAGQRASSPRLSPFTLALLLLSALGLLTLAGYFFSGLEQRLPYRIMVLGVVLACMLPGLAANARKHAFKGIEEGQRAERPFHLRLAVWISSGWLALVAVYVVLTFFFPVLLNTVRIRILNLAAIVIYILCFAGIQKSIGTQKLASAIESGKATPEGLARRFFTSLGILFLLPVYVALVRIFPALRDTSEMTVAVFGITGAAMIGLYSVGKDILDLLRILKKARLIARHETLEVIEACGGGEVGELANAFNVVIVELGETIGALQAAKQRIEMLVERIGAAVSSSESMQELLHVVLDISKDSLSATTGYLRILTTQSGRGELYITPKSAETLATDALQRKLDAVIESASPCLEANFLALPLLCKGGALGVLAVERIPGDPPFSSADMELLQSIGNQAALAVESSELRESEERIYLETISALALAVEAKDPYTRGHSKRVSELAAAIATKIGLDKEEIQDVRCSGLLHDIGKLGVPDSVLRKATVLSESEYNTLKLHPVTGERIVNAVTSLRKLRSGIRHHHERVDGKGYPDHLAGDAIDKKALIIGAADALDAMLSDRPYRKAYTPEKAAEELRKGSGTQFDADVALVLLSLLERGELPVSVPSQPELDTASLEVMAARLCICSCGSVVTLPPQSTGQHVRCPRCLTTLDIPTGEADASLIRWHCKCGLRLKATPKAAGRPVRCPRCAATTLVPLSEVLTRSA